MTHAQGENRIDVQLSFPPDISGEPLVCHLVRAYDLSFNILKARTTPRKEGYLTLELIGDAARIRDGIAYLKSKGVKVTGMAHRIQRDEALCMHCGMCTALCSSGALRVDPVSRLVLFSPDMCTACGLCTRVCPVGVMALNIRQDTL